MPEHIAPPPTKKALALIFVIVFIDLLGFGIIIPILPNFAQRGFGASDAMVGLLVGIFSFMQFIFTPIWGRISDSVGRKPILLFGLMCSVVGYLMFGLASSLTVLFLSRMLSGLGGANISAAQAYIADVTTPFNRAKGMGLIGMAFGLGFVFGPFMGGILVAYGYEYPGFAAAGLSALSLITTLIAL
ncbi:MAG: TCR/Tet family MFS transporter, partial [Chlorobi bacterium]|nr:TCR/Tet family MFS transporter [Chlorobiota bacterium]